MGPRRTLFPILLARTGGLDPHQTKQIWGKLWILPSNTDALLQQYSRDFGTP